MTKGKATAVASGRTVAETDEYETVEGNIYPKEKAKNIKDYVAFCKLSIQYESFLARFLEREKLWLITYILLVDKGAVTVTTE
ncbi:hypothetical protein LARI1_G009342 [Lachnellula arida]|uniref:Uncharacterized protein n=1 Tax=Lachnellula arida TaxID=1316785 RepID=A0A8T9B1P2_9HELO|nr:hypothetical protein LARI1_G009342 [Lachnellula arida]